MAKRIDPYSLPMAERERMLRNEAAELERAEIALGLAQGRAKAKFRRYVEARKANCRALSDAVYGKPDPMSIEQLYSELASAGFSA